MHSTGINSAPNPGLLLHRIRDDVQLSQYQLGSLLLLSRQTYSAYERGERPIPDEVWDRVLHCVSVPEELRTEIDTLRFRLSGDEKDLLSGFRRLDAEGRRQILTVLSAQIQGSASKPAHS